MTDQDSDANRTIDLTVEVPGTPEQIWDAIATGAGISSWLQLTLVEEHEGGAFSFDMGSGFSGDGVVGDWDPPHRFVTRTPWRAATGDAQLATEWRVEAHRGGSCTVRMVMTGFGSDEPWDDELDGLTEGMTSALQALRVYLGHFAGRRGGWIRAAGAAASSRHGSS